MNFDVAIVGFGVIGTESLFRLTEKLSNKKKLKIAIIEKNIKKIPGGIAYSKKNSKFGFFNNPLRLSSTEFSKWIKKKQSIEKLNYFIKKNKDFNLNSWIAKNKNFNIKDTKNFDEIYLPRLTYSFFLEEKIHKIIKNILKKNIIVKFYQGDLKQIERKKKLICKTKNKLKEFKPLDKYKKKKFIKVKNLNFKTILTKTIILGNGLLPPRFINEKIYSPNNNYIWDFYTEGGTLNLINKIKKISHKKKIIKLVFIGNKAGLLETMPELENLISNNRFKIKIITVAPNSLSLQKAQKSLNFNKFKFKFLIHPNIQKITKSEQILKLLKKEFIFSKKGGFNRYDVWTWVLYKNIMSKCYERLSIIEKKKYNDFTFPLIRKITRYTYPDTIYSKKRLEKRKILKFIKDKVTNIEKFKKKINVYIKRGHKISADIVINVSGPVNFNNVTKEVSFINSLKKISNNYNYRGFIANKDFSISKNIYAPGTISSNFNPNRLTIIKAVNENSHKVVNKILKNIE